MGKYKWLLFDADNTIFDFDAAEAESLQKCVESIGLPYSRQTFNAYHSINRKCWQEFERGNLAQSAIQSTRMSKFLKKLGSEACPNSFGIKYLTGLAESKILIEGIQETLKYLYPKYKLAVITNGLKQVQRKHFKNTGMDLYFDPIIVSDEIGVSKPNKAFFDYTFSAIGNPAPEEVLVIGDGLSSDIKGANAYRLDSVWFNKRAIKDYKKLLKENPSTYQIDDIRELMDIL